MPIKVRELERLLTSKFNFSASPDSSPDHRWYELALPGLPKIRTKVSHGMSETGVGLEGRIARQLRVHMPYFQGMFACTYNREDYYQQVRTAPFPPWDVRF